MIEPTPADTWNELPVADRQKAIQQAAATGENFMILAKAADGYGVWASAGPHYRYAVFGRDSLVVANDILTFQPDLAREILLFAASQQGVSINSRTDEEPGKLCHEYRARHYGGLPIPHNSLEVFRLLAKHWGGTDEEVRSYGACDTTPLYIRTVHRYVRAHGTAIMDEHVTRRDGSIQTVRESVREAMGWVTQNIAKSSWNLLEFRRMRPANGPYQAWKDSGDSYLHLDGVPANPDGGIASVEIQGLAYDALVAGAELFADNSDEAKQWLEMAKTLRDHTLMHLWMPEHRFFAMGLDRDAAGQTRQIATRTTNGAALLNSDLWSSLPTAQRLTYVEPIVRRTMSTEFLTEAGLRLRSIAHQELLDYADYHGCFVTWPKETHAIARGLHKQGFTAEAQELIKRLRDALQKAGEFYELFLVSADGRVKYHYRRQYREELPFAYFKSAEHPEPGQAWTISAFLYWQHR